MHLDVACVPGHGDRVTVCWRMSPLVLVALVALRARWLAGLIANSVGRTAAPATSSAPSTALSSSLSALRGSSGVVSQFFVWFYLVLGAILCLAVLARVLSFVIDEIRLQRECHRSPRRPPLDRWGRRTRRTSQ